MTKFTVHSSQFTVFSSRFIKRGGTLQDYTKLKVWEKAHAMVLLVYECTDPFPKSELYGLVSQMRRAAMSISMNIVEGSGRSTNKEFAHFLSISFGSASELQYQLLVAGDLKFLSAAKYQSLNGGCAEIKRMLAGLMERVRFPEAPLSRSAADCEL